MDDSTRTGYHLSAGLVMDLDDGIVNLKQIWLIGHVERTV